MRWIILLILITPHYLFSQIDLPGDDTLKKKPFFDMTNRGITRYDYFQGEVHCVLISCADGSEVCRYGSAQPGDHIDTVYLGKAEYFNSRLIDEFEFIGYCQYRKGTKWGQEVGFYTFDQLDGDTIKGWDFRVKFIGQWKDGKKNGKWIYYATDGTIEYTETWKDGILQKTERDTK